MACIMVACVSHAAGHQSVRDGGVPAGLSHGAWSDIQQQIAAARYEAAPIPAKPDTVGAHNPEQDLLLHFDQAGARLASLRNRTEADASPPQLRLQTLALARGTQRYAVTAVTPAAEGPRVEYRHKGWTEWYVNRAEGVEHGYTLQTPPLAGDEPLRIELAVSGYRASQADEALRFTDAAGRSLHYGKLLVLDADGQTLPATLTATAEDRIEIAFDDSAAKYPVIVDPVIVNLEQKLTDSAGAEDDQFGYAVAVDGDTALVGAPFFDTAIGVTNRGIVRVFERSGSSWSQQATLFPDDGSAGDSFGWSVALDGDTALVGARAHNTNGDFFRGAAYVFVRTGSTTWGQQAKLIASDGAAQDEFGFSVALDGDTALVGARVADVDGNVAEGAAYVFQRVFLDGAPTWLPQTKLVASNGAAGDQFGFSVALDGDTALIGVRFYDTDGGTDRGAARVFVRSGGSWSEQALLTGFDSSDGAELGYAVALDGNIALVGACLEDAQGAAYVYDISGGQPPAKLVASDAGTFDNFGCSVALDGGTALVGARSAAIDGAANQGAAYVFRTNLFGLWFQAAKFAAADGAADDFFGQAVALSGDTALVGAHRANVGRVTDRGAAYVFLLEIDSDGDGLPDDWETANGLDPNDPADAAADADGDGLSNLDEFDKGTDPNNPDSDGDGIGDAIDAEPKTVSNACTSGVSGRFAVFENTLVLGGTVAQCAASVPVDVAPTVTIEPGGRAEVYAPRATIEPGFVLPSGAEFAVTPQSAP